MSGAFQDRGVAGGAERPGPAWNPVADTATIILITVSATALAAVLVVVAQIAYLPALLLTGALVAAVLFGPTHGLLAVAGAMVAARLYGERHISHVDSRAVVFLLTAAAAIVAPWLGVLVRTVQADRRAAAQFPQPAPPLGERMAASLAGFARRQTSDFSWPLTLQKTRRGVVPYLILAVGAFAALVVRAEVGAEGGMQFMLVATLCVAAAFGSRYGVAAGILASVVLNDIVIARYGGVPLRAPSAALNVIVFAAVGWCVGLLADSLQAKRSALKVVVSASREISTTTDEAVIHRALFDSLVKLMPRSWVEIHDEEGASVVASPGVAPSSDAGPEALVGWHARPLIADGRRVGSVRWRYLGSEADVAIADEIAGSLVDLGGSAIVRARLSVEKSEMEFMARSEHLRTILLDAVSHHFRSPLAGIIGSVTSVLNLPDQHDREVRRELLLIIKEQANRLSRYVDNFLSVARLESGSIDVNLADVLIEPLIYDVWETFGEAGGARRFLQVKVDPQPVRADPGLLAQVLGNVLENAIKFSPEESIVDVRGHREGDKLVIEVTDQGVGVLSGNEDHIFRRFFRSPGAKAPGLGLGLYITRSLVQMQGGEVHASNRNDGESGLKVALMLPVAA